VLRRVRVRVKVETIPTSKARSPGIPLDLMIPARSLQFEMGPEGHRHVRMEAGLMVYNRAGNPLNWNLRQVNLNLDDSRSPSSRPTG